MKEEDIRRHVRNQRNFYTQACKVTVFNLVLILVWLLFDTGPMFWPKYVIFFSLIWMAIEAYQYGLFPIFAHKVQGMQNKFHFMSEDWEKMKVDEMLGKKSKAKAKAKPKASSKKTAQKKVVGRTKKAS